MSRKTLPRSVNLHFWRPCNMRCGFCFARYEETTEALPKGHLPESQLCTLIDELAEHGAEKLTFVGGEPTLCPWLDRLLARAKSRGLTTMIVSNAWRLRDPTYMRTELVDLDWLTLSVDSLDRATNLATGRSLNGQTLSAADLRRIAQQGREQGLQLKLNTVVSRLNADEDLSAFVRDLAPDRWKLFQVLPVGGQNLAQFPNFGVDTDAFEAFVERHRPLADHGIVVVPETNDDMRGTYAMIDPMGRFYDSTTGAHRYSRPILEVGVDAAWGEVCFDEGRFRGRGGDYEF